MKKFLILILIFILIANLSLLAQAPFYGDSRKFVSLDGTDTLEVKFENDSARLISSNGVIINDLYTDTLKPRGQYIYINGDTILQDYIAAYSAATALAAGNDNEIQFNDGGVLGSSSNFSWNDTTLNMNYGTSNVMIGQNAGDKLMLSGNHNTFLGANAGANSISSTGNVFIGSSAGLSVIANANVAIGYEAGKSAGRDNVFIGWRSGRITTGITNVMLGQQSGINATGSGNVFVGYQSGLNETGSNKLYIENSNSSSPLIKGDFSTDELWFNVDTTHNKGHLAIDSNLYVSGKVVLDSGLVVKGAILSQNAIYAAAKLPEDSATVTTCTTADIYYFAKGNFVNQVSRGVDFDGDTLMINQPNCDSTLIKFDLTASISSAKNATVTIAFSDNGGALDGTTKNGTFSAGETKSITHFGHLWVTDNEKIKIVVKSSAATNDLTLKNISVSLEQKFTCNNYNQ